VKKKIAALVGGLFVLVLGAMTLTMPSASAEEITPGPVWVTKAGSKILGKYKVELTGGNTSVEAANLNMTLETEAGATEVSFVYVLGDVNTQCVAGAPRVFLKVGETYYNSWDLLLPEDKQCGEPVEGDSDARLVTFTVPDGEITNAGVVYDNGKTGTVVVSNLMIGQELVDFTKVILSPTPSSSPSATPSESQSPSPSPTSVPSETPTSEPSSPPATSEPSDEPSSPPATVPPTTPAGQVIVPVGNNDDDQDGGGLPVTGAKIGYIAGLGAVIVGSGLGLMLLGRRRRDARQADLA